MIVETAGAVGYISLSLVSGFLHSYLEKFHSHGG
jgi:hypothetical protein